MDKKIMKRFDVTMTIILIVLMMVVQVAGLQIHNPVFSLLSPNYHPPSLPPFPLVSAPTPSLSQPHDTISRKKITISKREIDLGKKFIDRKRIKKIKACVKECRDKLEGLNYEDPIHELWFGNCITDCLIPIEKRKKEESLFEEYPYMMKIKSCDMVRILTDYQTIALLWNVME